MIYNGITKPPLGIKPNRTHRLSNGLVGCWLFNEGVGNKAYDSSGYGNHGALAGMAFPSTTVSGWNPGKDGGGLNFDGSDDYVNCGNDSSLDTTDAITIEAWVKSTSATIDQQIIHKGTNRQFLYGYSNNRFSMYFGSWIHSTNSFVPNSWHHFVATFDGTTTILYINGNNEGSGAGTTAPAATLYIGAYYIDSPLVCFNGSIDGVKIYNRALSASEIRELYRTPFCMFEIDDSWVLQAGKSKLPIGANIAAAKLLL